jgi:hypothetical protein
MGKLLIFLVFWLPLALWLYHKVGGWASDLSRHADWRLAGTEEYARSIAYALDGERATVWDLPASCRRLKLVANASLPAASVPGPDEEVRYAVRTRLFGPGEVLLRQQTCHFRARFTWLAARHGEAVGAFYAGTDLVASDGRYIFLDLAGLQAAPLRLELLAGECDEGVAGVVARLYAEQELHGGAGSREKARRAAKLEGAKLSVYPPDLLSQEEEEKLARREWNALAPGGVDGRDHVRRVLYVIKDLDFLKPEDKILPQGVLVDRFRCGIIPVARNDGLIRLEWVRVDSEESPEPRGRATLEVSWRDHSGKRREEAAALEAEEGSLHARLEAGAIALESDVPLVARAFLASAEGEEEITPEPLFVRSYLARPGEPIELEILHLGGAATPVRLDLRLMAAAGSRTEPLERGCAGYEMLEEQGAADAPLHEGAMELALPVSRYDAVVGFGASSLVTEPARKYFLVPPGCHRLRVTASERPLLVAAYNLPPAVARRTILPDDPFSVDRLRLERTWFPLRPAGEVELLKQGRSVVVQVQCRPPDAAGEAFDCDYEREEYAPEGEAFGRQLIVRRGDSRRVDAAARSPQLLELLPERSRPVYLESARGVDVAVLPFVYWSEGSEPVSIALFAGGALHGSFEVWGRSGQRLLPPLCSGWHELRVEASGDGRFFIGSAFHEDAGRFRRRFGYLLAGGREARVPFPKKSSGSELLAVEVQLARRAAGRTRLCVSIDGPPAAGCGPFASWTFRERLFELEAEEPADGFVIGGEGERLWPPRRCLLLLGEDMAPGLYSLLLSLEEEAAGYFTVSRAECGLFEQFLFFLEDAGRDHDHIVH